MRRPGLKSFDVNKVHADDDTAPPPTSNSPLLQGYGAPAAEAVRATREPELNASPERPRPSAVVQLAAGARQHEELLEEVAQLRKMKEGGEVTVSLPPEAIDPSPFPDRLDTTFQLAAFQVLKESIRTNGQDQPILVRPHPSQPGRYQVAYGHRRRRACLELGLNVKACIRNLDDDAMVAAQRRENEEREQPSFIEKAMQIHAMAEAGWDQPRIARILSMDRTLVHRKIQIGKIPRSIIDAIGPAPKTGRRKWETLRELLFEKGMEDEAYEAVANLTEIEGDLRIDELIQALTSHQTASFVEREVISLHSAPIAKARIKARSAQIVFRGEANKSFGEWLLDQLPNLHDRFMTERGD